MIVYLEFSKDPAKIAIKHLLKAGVALSRFQGQLCRESVLHYATVCEPVRLDILKMLIKGGADVNSQDMHGRTVLMTYLMNAEEPDIVVVRFYIEKGSSLDTVDVNN